MSRSSRFSIRSNLQNKMLLLALGPVLLITLILEVLATLESRRETRESLAEQRSALIESRQQGIKNLVDAAKASVSHLADAPPEQQAEAQARAREILGNVTFGGGNYLFVYDFQGNVAASRTDSVGGNSWDLQDEDGQYVIRDLIAAGDLFQANLTACCSTSWPSNTSALELFHRIRERCPAPFAGLVITENHDALLSSSPERFVSVDCSGRVQTRPI